MSASSPHVSLQWNVLAPLLCALCLIALFRASLERSIWSDEIYTIRLINHQVAELIDLTAIDNHPPAYYLFLKAWIRLGRIAGVAPSIFWGRLPGVLGWLMLVATAWLIGRRTLGDHAGPILAAGVAVCAQALRGMADLRNYSIATPALGIAFLILFLIFELHRRNELITKMAALLWTLYGLLASLALWSHLLASFALTALGLCWIAEILNAIRRSGIKTALHSPLFLGGAVAQSIAALAFSPWIFQLQNQVLNLGAERRYWLTPTTFLNLVKVPFLWHAMGPLPDIEIDSHILNVLTGLGTMTLLLPALIFFKSRKPSTVAPNQYAFSRLAAFGLGAATINFTLIWLTDRLGIQHVFHGPRYTMFGVIFWAAGLAGLSMGAARRLGRPAVAWLLLAPWLLFNFAGLIYDVRFALVHGESRRLQIRGDHMPSPGERIYFLPEFLSPYFSRTLADYEIVPIHNIVNEPDGASLTFLHAMWWYQVNSQADLIIRSALGKPTLADQIDTRPMSPTLPTDYEVIRLHNFHPSVLRELIADGLTLKQLPAPEGTVAFIQARDLLLRDGWDTLELSGNGTPFRWSRASKSLIRLPITLEPGLYRAHLKFQRVEYFTGPTTISLTQKGNPHHEVVTLRGTEYQVDLPLRIEREASSAVFDRPPLSALELHHPVARSADPNAADDRKLGLLFERLSIYPSEHDED